MIYSLYIAHHAHSYVHLQNTCSGVLSRPIWLDLKYVNEYLLVLVITNK